METKIVRFIESVGSFFNGGDQIPWSDPQTTIEFENVLGPIGDAKDGTYNDTIMRLSWSLVHSKKLVDVQCGITLLKGSLAQLSNGSNPQRQKEKLYLLAVGYYRSGSYSMSKHIVQQCLRIEPNWPKALYLMRIIEEKKDRDGIIRFGIRIGAVGFILASILCVPTDESDKE